MPRNNRLGSQPQSTPMPRDYDPEVDEDFSVTRVLDGHATYPSMEDRGDGNQTWTRANRHHPDASEDESY